jgi:hypothetical protein
MRRQRRKYSIPAADLTRDDKLKGIANGFKANLTRVAQVAMNGKGKAKEYAADHTAGMPKKHVIATIFALCEEDLCRVLGPLWWRCSMSEAKKKGTPTITKLVKTVLAAVENKAEESYDEWPPIEEFMHDFSASSHSIPQARRCPSGLRPPCRSNTPCRGPSCTIGRSPCESPAESLFEASGVIYREAIGG